MSWLLAVLAVEVIGTLAFLGAMLLKARVRPHPVAVAWPPQELLSLTGPVEELDLGAVLASTDHGRETRSG